MTVCIKTRAFITCPRCDKGEFIVQHLIDNQRETSVGPWQCDNDHCCAAVSLHVSADGQIEITKIEDGLQTALVLFKICDVNVYLIAKQFVSDGDSWDYLYHSHQCPINQIRQTHTVFDSSGGDPHGLLRYVGEIRDTPDNLKRLEDQTPDLKTLFDMFATDGAPRKSRW